MRISDWSSDVCSSDLAGGGLRRGVEDRGAARGAALAAVADGRQLDDAGLDERVGRLHVHHLGRSGIADRPAAAHEEEAVLVDRQRRIVDAAVIVFRPLEDDGTALEDVLVAGTAAMAPTKGGAGHPTPQAQ